MTAPGGVAAAPSARLSWRVLTIIAVVLFAAFRLPELTRYSLWYDELFSLALAQSSWTELFAAAIRDRTNPPLFYALLKVWTGVGGESVAWMRLLPCLLGVAVAVPMMALAKRSRVPAFVALALAASSPLAVFLSNELRGYSLMLLLTACSMVAFDRMVEADSKPITRAAQLVIVNVLLVYTHYFGWLVVGAQLLIVALWHRRVLRIALLAALATGVVFAPWATAVLASSSRDPRPLDNVGWITKPGFGDVIRFYDALVARVPTPGTAWIGAIVVGVPVAVAMWALVFPSRSADGPGSGARANRRRELALYAAFPVVVALLPALIGARAVFVPRYLIVAAPAWWLLVAEGVAWSGSIRVAPRLRVAFIAWVVLSGALRMFRGGEKIAWDQLVASIVTSAAPAKPTVYVREGFTALPVAYYGGAKVDVVTLHQADGVKAPGWIVARDAGGALPPLGAGLAATAVRVDSTPAMRIVTWRVTAP